ncbi:hypothetical protein WG909_05335 [Peptostreptococcaceae bacterium AGR-M142]
MNKLAGYIILSITSLVGSIIMILAKISYHLQSSGISGWWNQIPIISYFLLIVSYAIGIYLILGNFAKQKS